MMSSGHEFSSIAILALLLQLCSCSAKPVCPNTITEEAIAHPATAPQAYTDSTPYVSSLNPYSTGALRVSTIDVPVCQSGAPLALRVHVPSGDNAYPVIVFQHGFLALNLAYDELLTQVASHGFVVVAPQMYTPGLAALSGRPSAAEEADMAARLLDWLPGNLGKLTGAKADTEKLGIAGHSRGGKVMWLLLAADSPRVKAVAAIDPVDGQGGPLGNQPRALENSVESNVPSLIIGAGLGGACSPEGDNHVQFFQASGTPAWHIVATNHGHADMLDSDLVHKATLFCKAGPHPADMRQFTAAMLTAFFQGTLQGDPSTLRFLDDSAAAPIEISVESR